MEADGSPAAAAPPAPQEQQLRRSSSDASSGRSSDSSDGADSASGSEDDESGSDSESSSEDDLSDNETLASRHKKRASAAAEQAVKRRRSSSDTGSGSSSHRRKRRNLFPVIRKSQRCGKCHTCTNPQLKKACLTVREQMMREATKGSKKSKGSAPAAPPAAASSSRPQAGSSSSSSGDVDKYTDLLLPFINSAGGISDVASVQPFIKAMGSFSSSLARMLPCTVLGLSSAAVLAEFMARGGVDVLSGWMLTAMQEDSEQASQFLAEALSALKKLPVTKGFVQGTKSAKVIGALRKHDSSDVRRLSRDVVALWMKAIPAGTKPAGAAASSKPSAAGEQREAALAAAALPAAKRLKTSGQVLTAGCCRSCEASFSAVRNGACCCEALCASCCGFGLVLHVIVSWQGCSWCSFLQSGLAYCHLP